MEEDFRLSTAREDVDRDLVHFWLSEQAYWAKGRSREMQDAAIDGSRNYSVRGGSDDRQLAYARVVTDGATFAWLCDVFVDESARGAGVGKFLVRGVLDDLDALGVGRTLLATQDAHGLYRQYGFALLEPGRWMGRGRL